RGVLPFTGRFAGGRGYSQGVSDALCGCADHRIQRWYTSMKVLLLSRYADLGASSRVRYLQYVPYLEQAGITFAIRPLFSNRYLERLYQGKRARWEVLKCYFLRVLALLQARRFDVLIIEKELFPFMPAWAERALKWAGVRYLADYDD